MQGDLDNHLIEIGTGEGKSVALGITAVLLTLLGFTVDVVCYSRSANPVLMVRGIRLSTSLSYANTYEFHMHIDRYLCERDYKEFEELFVRLGVRKFIHYEDFNSLSSTIMDNGVYLPNVSKNFLR